MHKKTQKQLTSILQNKKYRVLLVGVCCSIFLFGIFAGFVLINTANTRRLNIDKLEEVSKDLYDVYKELIVGQESTIDAPVFKRVCYKASGKYNSGSIQCGSEGTYILQDGMTYEGLAEIVSAKVKKVSAFTPQSTDWIREYNNREITGFVINFIHKNTGIICYISVGADDRMRHHYRISCSQIVPDYLPGYERQ